MHMYREEVMQTVIDGLYAGAKYLIFNTSLFSICLSLSIILISVISTTHIARHCCRMLWQFFEKSFSLASLFCAKC